MLSTFGEQRQAVGQAKCAVEKEMTRTNDEELYNELLAQKNGLISAYESLCLVERLVEILRQLGV